MRNRYYQYLLVAAVLITTACSSNKLIQAARDGDEATVQA